MLENFKIVVFQDLVHSETLCRYGETIRRGHRYFQNLEKFSALFVLFSSRKCLSKSPFGSTQNPSILSNTLEKKLRQSYSSAHLFN